MLQEPFIPIQEKKYLPPKQKTNKNEEAAYEKLRCTVQAGRHILFNIESGKLQYK